MHITAINVSMVTARIKDTSEYNWFKFTGKRPMEVVHGNGKTVVELEAQDVFGLRLSSSGKQYRMVTQKTGLTKVFTVNETEYKKLLKFGTSIRAPRVGYRVDAANVGSFKTRWSPTEIKLIGILANADEHTGIELETLRQMLAGRAWKDLHKIPAPVDQAIENLVRGYYALKSTKNKVTTIYPVDGLQELFNHVAKSNTNTTEKEYTMDSIAVASAKLLDMGIPHAIVSAKSAEPKYKSFKAFSGSLKTQQARKYAMDYYVWVTTGRKGAAPAGDGDPKTYQLWKYIRTSIQQILKADEAKKKAAKK